MPRNEKGRGCNKTKVLKKAEYVDVNEHLQPISDSVRQLSTLIGCLARDPRRLPLDCWDWRKMDRTYLDSIWEEAKISYYFPENREPYKWALGKIHEAWRAHKSELKVVHFDGKTHNQAIQSRPKEIPESMWLEMVKFWESPKGKERSQRGILNRAKSKMCSYAGSKSFARIRAEEKEKMGKEPDELEMWLKTHEPKKGYSKLNDASAATRKAILDEMTALPEGCDANARREIFKKVVGEDRNGYAKTFGLGVKVPRSHKRRCAFEEERAKRIKSESRVEKLEKDLLETKEQVGYLTGIMHTLLENQENNNTMCEYRAWEELMPDTLGLIFRKLPLLDILITVPRVCKSWANAVMGPYCWQEIDIEEWSRNCQPDLIDKMIKVLVARSCGSLRKLSVYGLSSNTTLHFIADHANFLQKLQLPRSEISDPVLEQVASTGKLSTITFLDLSYCTRIGAPALRAIGKHCTHLTVLLRNMNPWDIIDKVSQDDEALAIASTMTKLKHLELSYLIISTEALINIVSSCLKLELLDVKGCWHVKLEKEFLEGFRRLKVVGPLIDDDNDNYYENNVWEQYSDYSGTSSYLAWNFVADEMEDYDDDDNDMLSDYVWDDEDMGGLEFMFYDDLI